MRHPAFAVLACVWLALFGLGFVRPSFTTALREPEGAGPVASAASPDQGQPPAAFLQIALLALSPSTCDEEILAAGEMPLWSGQRTRAHLEWFRRAFAHDFGATTELLGARRQEQGDAFLLVERQRELGSDFPWGRVSGWVVATPELAEHSVKLASASIAGQSWWGRRGRWPWDSWCEPGVEHRSQQVGRDLELEFERPQLLLHDTTGFVVLLRATRTTIGREALERRATWRTFFASWLGPAAANERDLAAEQLSLAGLVLRDAPLLAAARAAPLPSPLADDAGGWRRFARRALAIAHGTLPPDDSLDSYGCEPVLAVRALRTQPNTAIDAELARQLLASQSAPFSFVPLASLLGDGERAASPAIVALREAATVAGTPSWLRGRAWLLPSLLAAAAAVLGWLVLLPRVGAVRPLSLGGMLVLSFALFVMGSPYSDMVRALVLVPLCGLRWRAMGRLWRLVAGATIAAQVVGGALSFGLLPATAPWHNVHSLTVVGTWLLAFGVIVADRRWRAPSLLLAVVALQMTASAGLLVPGLAPLGLLAVQFGFVYGVVVAALLLLFLLFGRRRLAPAAHVDEPPLVAAQPA